MSPPNWDRLQEIYHSALALPPSERDAFVTTACADDPDLLRQVHSLLKTGPDFLKEPVFLCPSIADSLVGTTIDGRYVVQRELLAGGMGRVYVARDLQLPGRLVVIKVLPQTSIEDPNAVIRAKREIQALTVIDHPNVVSVLGAGEAAGKPYIAMQYIEGVTLRSQIPSNGMDVKRASSILKQIGAALGHIHNQGVLHRDLKPENIMIQVLSDGTEVVKILDFGIAKIKDSVAATSTVNTVAIGTIAYMSPEQLRGGDRITAASDIYSLAVVACEMITGRRPILAAQEQRSITALDLPPGLSEKAAGVIIRALSFDPNNRYQSAKEFADDLERALFLGEEKGSGAPAWWRRQKKSLAVFGGALILAFLGYGIYKYLNRPTVPIHTNEFKYWVMVQRMRDDKEYQEPLKSYGEETFFNGDKFQLNVSTTQSGYLYIFNEGPPEPDMASFKMIFPNRAINNGSASVGANQTVQSDWITFRGAAGAENLWIVWSISPVGELEFAKNEAFNHPQQGLTVDQLPKVKEFLKTMEVKVDSRTRRYKESKVATVRGQTDMLVVLAQFKHQ